MLKKLRRQLLRKNILGLSLGVVVIIGLLVAFILAKQSTSPVMLEQNFSATSSTTTTIAVQPLTGVFHGSAQNPQGPSNPNDLPNDASTFNTNIEGQDQGPIQSKQSHSKQVGAILVNESADKTISELPLFEAPQMLSCKKINDSQVDIEWQAHFTNKGTNWYQPTNMTINGDSFIITQRFSTSDGLAMLERFDVTVTSTDPEIPTVAVTTDYRGIDISKGC